MKISCKTPGCDSDNFRLYKKLEIRFTVDGNGDEQESPDVPHVPLEPDPGDTEGFTCTTCDEPAEVS